MADRASALELTPEELTPEQLAGVTTAQQVGVFERGAAGRRFRGVTGAQRREQAFLEKRRKEEEEERKRQERKAKQQQRLATAFQVGGAILGAALAIPTGGVSMLAGAGMGARIGGAVGTAAAGRPPGPAAQAVPGLLGALEAKRSYGERRAGLQEQLARLREEEPRPTYGPMGVSY